MTPTMERKCHLDTFSSLAAPELAIVITYQVKIDRIFKYALEIKDTL